MKRKLPSYSLKTCQTLGPKEQSEFAKSWPKEGMIVDGVIYPLVMWERNTKGKDGFCWPTPMLKDAKTKIQKRIMKNNRRLSRNGITHSLCLAETIIMFPTPNARDWKDNASPSEYKRHTPTLATQANGRLNPQWVEWLMGYLIGWTELKPLETQ